MTKLRSIQARFEVPSHVQLIEVDITDAAAAASLAERARTILSTAGPFANVGEPLVAACAHNGTDYVDVSGAAVWIRKILATRKSVVSGKSVAVRVDPGGRRILKTKK